MLWRRSFIKERKRSKLVGDGWKKLQVNSMFFQKGECDE